MLLGGKISAISQMLSFRSSQGLVIYLLTGTTPDELRRTMDRPFELLSLLGDRMGPC